MLTAVQQLPPLHRAAILSLRFYGPLEPITDESAVSLIAVGLVEMRDEVERPVLTEAGQAAYRELTAGFP